ncbi:MAG: UDP-N-acetylglucosamine 2-epimerase, partial [Planctomycetota bacterium]
MSIRTIAVVTSSRADYGHLVWPLRRLSEQPGLSVRLMVTGAHLSPEFGGTVEVIERDGFAVDDRIECLLSADTDIAMAKTIGLATISFASAWAEARPDLLLLIADRYEMLAPASAALAMRVPIAHIEGGEASEG